MYLMLVFPQITKSKNHIWKYLPRSKHTTDLGARIHNCSENTTVQIFHLTADYALSNIQPRKIFLQTKTNFSNHKWATHIHEYKYSSYSFHSGSLIWIQISSCHVFTRKDDESTELHSWLFTMILSSNLKQIFICRHHGFMNFSQ